VEADKFSVHLANGRLRVVSESLDLRTYLDEVIGLEIRGTLAGEALLLGRPAVDGAVGTPAWVLYESNSVVLRRSLREDDVFQAAAYHLLAADAAMGSDRLALLVRTVVLPSGGVWLFDPFVLSELAGLDRRMLRAGCTVLPTTIASIDVATGEVVLPDHPFGDQLPAGRRPIERMLMRTWPDEAIEGVEALRLARVVIRHRKTDLDLVLRQILELVGADATPLELLPAQSIEETVGALATLGSTIR
jgi:hypothetical protein